MPDSLELTLIPTSVPIPLKIVGTDQFDWRAPFRNELDGLHVAVGQTTIDHNTLYHWAIDGFGALVHSVDQMVLRTANAESLIETERLQRVDENLALAQQITTLGVKYDDASAKITQEQLARADQDSALAYRLDQQTARIDDSLAQISEERTTRVDADGALAESITILEAQVEESSALIIAEQTARANAIEAFAQTLTGLYATHADVAASIEVETLARANDTKALASQITTLDIAINGDTATGVVGLSAEIDTLSGQIGATWEATLTVNGLVGGFKLKNDSQSVGAVFDVDTFAVGRTLGNNRRPFMMEDDIVYIDDAAIKKLTFTKLRADDNSLIFENGKLKADYITATEAIIGTASIDTLHLKGNAVTIPVTSVATQMTDYFIGSDWVEVLECWLDMTSMPQLITAQAMVNFLAHDNQGDSSIFLRICQYHGAQVVRSPRAEISVITGFSTCIPFTYGFSPILGVQKFTIEVMRIHSNTNYRAGARSLVVFGAMK